MPVYFIGNNNGQVKIGYSKNPASRLSALQTASPYPLKILALKSGGTEVEADLHKRFSESRLEGEWFRLTTRLEAEIEQCLLHCSPHDLMYLNNEERAIFEDAFTSWALSTDLITDEYDAKIQMLEDEIERLENERDRKCEAAEQILDEKIEGISPWWLREGHPNSNLEPATTEEEEEGVGADASGRYTIGQLVTMAVKEIARAWRGWQNRK